MNRLKIYSVSEFNSLVRMVLGEDFGTVVVQGEVTGYRRRAGKLIFFEIKDKESRMNVFMLDHQLDVEIEDGMEVQVYGAPSLFKKNSGFHLRAVRVEPVGEGALAEALQLLKKKLDKEGLFAPERKRLLPRFPQKIGLITSPDAAAYNDVLRILQNRWTGLQIVFHPAQVQGDGSVNSIITAFDYFKDRKDIEAIILTRGGGSLEDLQSFNSEKIARAIFSSHTPVVVGVGHERDWTIADLVADKRAATPSNAAEIVVPDKEEVMAVIDTFERTIFRVMIDGLEDSQRRWQDGIAALFKGPQRWQEHYQQLFLLLGHKFASFTHKVSQKQKEVISGQQRLTNSISFFLTRLRDRLEQYNKLIKTLSPRATLERGYSLTVGSDGKILRSSKQVAIGDRLHTRLASGSIISETKETND
ncbi:MAG: exodeoxyribonuclease VII large subunit [Patescibacteria group bacterium]